ncbi:hypothetical protein SAMN05660900_00814 [Megasphaera cerevisiae DSM 20462]|nr:hypothetical protein SAMN05660900_00814 [Megasphaera cerevisiae DSM 20462]
MGLFFSGFVPVPIEDDVLSRDGDAFLTYHIRRGEVGCIPGRDSDVASCGGKGGADLDLPFAVIGVFYFLCPDHDSHAGAHDARGFDFRIGLGLVVLRIRCGRYISSCCQRHVVLGGDGGSCQVHVLVRAQLDILTCNSRPENLLMVFMDLDGGGRAGQEARFFVFQAIVVDRFCPAGGQFDVGTGFQSHGAVITIDVGALGLDIVAGLHRHASLGVDSRARFGLALGPQVVIAVLGHILLSGEGLRCEMDVAPGLDDDGAFLTQSLEGGSRQVHIVAGIQDDHALIARDGNACRAVQHVLVRQVLDGVIHGNVLLSFELDGVGSRDEAALMDIRIAGQGDGVPLDAAHVVEASGLYGDGLALENACILYGFLRVDDKVVRADEAALGIEGHV